MHFLMHWRNGDKSFTWNGVVYTTEREDKRTIEDAKVSHQSIMLDFVILTEDRYEKPKNINWYIKNVLNEDSILLNEIANLGFSVKELAGHPKSFDWSNVKYVILELLGITLRRLNDFRLWMKKTSKKTKFINPYSQILWNLDKVYLNDFKNQGINVVPSFFVNQKCSLQVKL